MPPPLIAAGPLGVGYRPADEADLPFLFGVYASTRLEELAQTGWPAEMQTIFLRQQFDAQHHHYRTYYSEAEWLVVQWRGADVGRLYFEEWPSQVRIIDIALLPAARGHGLGAAILQDMLALAAGLSKAASIHVEKNNPAMRLYRRLGFATVEDKGVYDLMEWRAESAPGEPT
ncbi:N-acetyltransferase [Sphingomonas parva]|uniref:N-acetyltransferase n=1 Tax=Sphingomonas parva TaxID=2555898 RepID=A0A4Y8ZRK9_9SPHN|nr:GNAT family N-acetyltransferase [Sphingomonas parva]TFI57765.1 N-acetyltransferase [Sphingomonas parva]